MSDLEHSRELQEKVELYFIALIFTILGLAIQTAKFGTNQVADALEILGWLSLVVSGLTGLSRLEWVPVALKTNSQLQKVRNERQQLADAAEGGLQRVPVVDQLEPADIHELIAGHDNTITKAQSHLNKIEKRIYLKYAIHKWSFVLGLLLLVGARGYTPAVGIFTRPMPPTSGVQQTTGAPSSSTAGAAPHQ